MQKIYLKSSIAFFGKIENMRKNTILFTLCLLLILSCKPKGDKERVSSLQKDSTLQEQINLSQSRAAYDSIRSERGSAPSLSTICSLAAKIIKLKDSIEEVRKTTELTDPMDSLIFSSLEMKGYHAILSYKRLLMFGVQLPGDMPNIIRHEQISDRLSLDLLPKVEKSGFLVDKHFFFLGGGPFLTRVNSEDGNAIFNDSTDNPEIRFKCAVNENTKFILDAILHSKRIRMNILYGSPLYSYYTGQHEVKGIGSIIHEPFDSIPVFFLTEEGVVPASIVSIKHKLVPEYLGCSTDNPEVVFACSSLINKEIFGVYIPHDSTPLTSCMILKEGKLWMVDINGDGTPDLASVSDTFAGASSDKLAHVIWYVNINGEWKIIDQATEPDCT